MTGSGRMDDAAGARAAEEVGWHDIRGAGGLKAAMGWMVNDVGSRDDAADARVKEEVGWYDVRTRVFEGVRGVACRARAVWARRWAGWSMMCDRGMTRGLGRRADRAARKAGGAPFFLCIPVTRA